MKRITSLLLAAVMIVCLTTTAFASDSTTKADALYTLDLFLGYGDVQGAPVYGLNDELTRAQGIILLVRMLGKEKDALAGNWKHPFTDTKDYYDPYVGYAYENGLTKGIGENLYGGDLPTNDQMFATFCIRALGYTDKTSADDSNSDFWWADAPAFAKKLGITVGGSEKYTRGNAVETFWDTLGKKVKNSVKTLANMLINDGVFTEAAYQKAVDISIGKTVADYKKLTQSNDGADTDESEIIPISNSGSTSQSHGASSGGAGSSSGSESAPANDTSEETTTGTGEESTNNDNDSAGKNRLEMPTIILN